MRSTCSRVDGSSCKFFAKRTRKAVELAPVRGCSGSSSTSVATRTSFGVDPAGDAAVHEAGASVRRLLLDHRRDRVLVVGEPLTYAGHAEDRPGPGGCRCGRAGRADDPRYGGTTWTRPFFRIACAATTCRSSSSSSRTAFAATAPGSRSRPDRRVPGRPARYRTGTATRGVHQLLPTPRTRSGKFSPNERLQAAADRVLAARDERGVRDRQPERVPKQRRYREPVPRDHPPSPLPRQPGRTRPNRHPRCLPDTWRCTRQAPARAAMPPRSSSVADPDPPRLRSPPGPRRRQARRDASPRQNGPPTAEHCPDHARNRAVRTL